MNKHWILPSFILIALLACNCSAKYKSLDTNMSFGNTQNIGEYLKVGYQFGIYSPTFNKKYYKKEKKVEYESIMIQIENTSNVPVYITDANFKIFVGDRQIQPIELEKYAQEVKQSIGAYLLHGLWGPWIISEKATPEGSSLRVFYIPVGLGVGFYNLIIANKANKKHEAEIQLLDVYNRYIKPNEKITGVITFNQPIVSHLTFKYLE